MPSCFARSAAAPNCRSAVHCTNSTNSISPASAPSRKAAHLASSGCRHSSGHSHHGLPNLCRSTSKQAKCDSKRAALGTEFVKILLAGRLGVGLESSKSPAQRPPLQAGDADIIDDIACPQRRQRLACFGIGLKFGKLFNVDIERVEKQPAVRRIRAAVARAVVEQGVQRIEADAVGAEMIGEFDQAGEVGEVAHAPVARGADAVKLDREQPATVEFAAKCPFRRRNQRHILGGRSIAHLKPVDARRQVRGPVDGVIRALAFGDNA